MNKILIALMMCAAMMMPVALHAKKKHITEADRVTLTFYDGSKVNGYLYDHWFRGIYYGGRQNYKLSIVPKIDSDKKEKDEYTLNDIMAIDFDSPTVTDAHWRACKVAQFEHEKLMQLLEKFTYQFMCVVAGDTTATIFKCPVVLKATVGDNETYEAVQYGVMFKGNPVVYPIVTDGKMDLGALYHHLKGGKTARLVRYLKQQFKMKANTNMVERDPTTFLNIYADYLLSEQQ